MDRLPGTGALSLRETQAGYVIVSAPGLLPGARGCEVAVDLTRRAIRVAGRANTDAPPRLLRFDEVAGCEIMRCGLSACLLLRLAGDAGALPAAFGKRSALEAVRRRLEADLAPVARQVSSWQLVCGSSLGRLKAQARPEFA